MRNKWVVGDLHGGLKGLQQLLERAPVALGDEIIFLGDYVDGWSESAQLIKYLIQLEADYRCIFVRGNHDDYCYNWLSSGKANPVWLKHGGLATQTSYKSIPDEALLEHIHFFERLLNYYIDEHNCLFIHAGFTSMQGPQQEFHQSMYNWDRTLWEMALTVDSRIQKDSKSYPKRLLLFKEIFIGHTPTLYYDKTIPMNACNVWNIDTGAAFTGKATIMNVDTKAFYQSDTLMQLYPHESGRN